MVTSSSVARGRGRKRGAEWTARSEPGRLHLTTSPPARHSMSEGCVPMSVNDGWKTWLGLGLEFVFVLGLGLGWKTEVRVRIRGAG